MSPWIAEQAYSSPLRTPGSARLGSVGRFSEVEGERQSWVERLDHPGGHLRGGVPIPGADAAAPLQFPASPPLVAHQLIDHVRRDALLLLLLLLQPGREAVPKIVGSPELQVREVGLARRVAVWKGRRKPWRDRVVLVPTGTPLPPPGAVKTRASASGSGGSCRRIASTTSGARGSRGCRRRSWDGA
jgi:hypothetical protein